MEKKEKKEKKKKKKKKKKEKKKEKNLRRYEDLSILEQMQLCSDIKRYSLLNSK
jgi:hypothetical protein